MNGEVLTYCFFWLLVTEAVNFAAVIKLLLPWRGEHDSATAQNYRAFNLELTQSKAASFRFAAKSVSGLSALCTPIFLTSVRKELIEIAKTAISNLSTIKRSFIPPYVFKTFFNRMDLMKKIVSTFPVFRATILFVFSWLSRETTVYGQAGTRAFVSLNKSWKFIKENERQKGQAWSDIRLPHTWNAEDVMDDEPGYYRGIGWYKKEFMVGKTLADKEVSIYFEGSNQETEVFVNGKKAGQHIGGYTAFSIPVSQLLKFGQSNELMVKVDNSFNENIAPLSADFTFYGGIYRDVYLTATSKIHFSTNDHATSGVYLTTPYVSGDRAGVNIRCKVSNETKGSSKLFVVTRIVDAKGGKVAAIKSSLLTKAFSDTEVVQEIDSIKRPKLWSPEHPYLYRVVTTIADEKGTLLDQVSNPLGFRWFKFDADEGFFLNGHPYKLVGVSRHQDYKGLGNAVPDRLAVKDVALMKAMGVNFFRIAHYPQDPCIMRACDSLGLLASVEIPIVNEITESEAFYRNCEQMQTEMIRQNFNHPSVIMWCYMNEVLLRTHFNDDTARSKKYISNINLLAHRLENLTRKEDPTRYTMMAYHGNYAQYRNAGLLEIPMIAGWNLYSGWYGGTMSDFPKFLDKFHKDMPAKPFIVSEYGADGDPRIRSSDPVRFDKSIEYATNFHKYYFTEMMKRKFVAGAVIWNLADFNSETRSETMPHINNKGLMQWDRTPKDPYYFYQAVLSRTPFIKVLGSCQNRYGIADSNSCRSMQALRIASNLDSVDIIVNGQAETRMKVVDGLCEWSIPFKEGQNVVIAEGEKDHRRFYDSSTIQFHLQAPCLASKQIPFKAINILLGSTRCFTDEKGQWWQPDQAYKKGGWGSVGGSKFQIDNGGRLPYGTDKNITGTDDDPIYQTQITGIRQYRLEVPPGRYEVTFHFAELKGGTIRVSPSNLGANERTEQVRKRIFDVSVNGKVTLDHLNIEEQYGRAKAVVQSTTVTVDNDEGVVIDFTPIEDEPVLNALQLKRLD